MTLIDRLNNGDHFARTSGIQLTEVGEGYARAEMTVDEQHLNAAGVCQGGAIYTLADLSFAAVTNNNPNVTLGISNTITFLHSAHLGDRLTALCTATYDHHRLPYCDIKVTNQDGQLIAVMTGLAYRTRRQLTIDN